MRQIDALSLSSKGLVLLAEETAVAATAIRRRNPPKPPQPIARRRRTANLTRTAFILPSALLFTVIMLVPIGANLFYGFTDWNGYTADFNFVGLKNFDRLAADLDTFQALLNTLVFTFVNAPLQVGIGLVLALSLRRPGRFVSFVRVVIVVPIAISGVVLGFLGSLLFNPGTGLLAAVSIVPGLGFLDQNWLGDPALAMVAVIAMNTWQWAGFSMLIFLAGLSTIPEELYEAATIDGAGRVAQFRFVTWPMLAPAVTINTVLTVIGGLKVFDIIFILTKGGPGRATESIVMRVAQQGSLTEYGYSAAMSFALSLVILVISLVLLGLLKRREVSA